MVPTLRLKILSEDAVERIHGTSLRILEEVGVYVPNNEIINVLKSVGCEVDFKTSIVKIPENIVVEMVRKASKSFTLYSRSGKNVVFGDGKFKVISSGGMMNIIDPWQTKEGLQRLKTP
jgi:trimethylamine--corrinoid protein Co-methyltransferase